MLKKAVKPLLLRSSPISLADRRKETSSRAFLLKYIPATDWQTAIFQQLAKVMEIDDQPEASWRVRRPTAAAYKAAVSLISKIVADKTLPLPRIAPDREGGLQLEWAKGPRVVEINISRSGTIELLTSDGRRDREDGHVSITTAGDAVVQLART
jgi:hypothetical protein